MYRFARAVLTPIAIVGLLWSPLAADWCTASCEAMRGATDASAAAPPCHHHQTTTTGAGPVLRLCAQDHAAVVAAADRADSGQRASHARPQAVVAASGTINAHRIDASGRGSPGAASQPLVSAPAVRLPLRI